MEKTKIGTVIPLDANWNDLGGWKSIWDNTSKDANGNSVIGKVILDDSQNSYIRSEGRLIVGLGLKDLLEKIIREIPFPIPL